MSSLMQHHGGRDKTGRKVELLMYLQHRDPVTCPKCDHCGADAPVGSWDCTGCGREFWGRKDTEDGDWIHRFTAIGQHPERSDTAGACIPHRPLIDSEPVTLTRPNGTTTTCPKLYRIFRRPVGMMGCWVVFRWDNAEHVPDLSVPVTVEKLPRDAKPLTDEEAAQYWFN
jgi:hypothetical protein